MKAKDLPLNTLAAAWPEPAWKVAAREAKEAISRGLFLPPLKKLAAAKEEVLPVHVRKWRAKVTRLHVLAAGSKRTVRKVPLAGVMRRVR